MVRKGLTILALFLAMIVLGILETINVTRVIDTMENIFVELNREYELNQDDITIFYDDICDAEEIWERNGNWLSHVFNHRDLSSITDSINRLQAYTKNNDYDNAICELSLLTQYYSKDNHVMGFSFQNLL